MSNSDWKYFAQADSEHIGSEVWAKLQTTQMWMSNSSVRKNYARAHMHSYASIDMGNGTASALTRSGEQGELSAVRVNRASSFAKALLGLLLGPKLMWRPQAVNGDPKRRAAVKMASNLLEWLWKTRHMNETVTRWIDQGIRLSESFVFAQWDWQLGPTAGGGKRLGDLNLRNVLPWDIFRDDTYDNFDACPWLCVRLFVNKHDIPALYPNDVLGEPTVDRHLSAADLRLMSETGVNPSRSNDVVPLFHFFHRPTASMPEGRQVIFSSPSCVLEDQPLRYGKIPIIRFAPDNFDGSPYGYTSFFDTLGVQEEIDGLETSIATNQLTLGTQSVVFEEGTVLNADDVAGMKAIYIRPGAKAPMPLQLTQTAPELFKHLDRLNAAQRDIMGLNDVAMGQPQGAQMNADAFTILASMAQQRNAPIQQRVMDAVGALGSICLDSMKRFIDEPRKIAIAGKHDGFTDLSFQGSDLNPIEDVFVEVGNAMEQSIPGRYALAKMYTDMGAVKTPEQLQQVVETGRLEPVTDPLRDAELLVSSENDELREGQPVVVHFSDDHQKHCGAHQNVLNNPESRRDIAAVKAVHEHIDAHYIEYWGLPPGQPAQSDPMYAVRLKMLLGQQPPPVEGAPPPEMGAAPGPKGPPPPGLEQPETPGTQQLPPPIPQ